MKEKSKIIIIVAKGKQNQIGLNNAMPWHLSDDLKNFKKLTSWHPIIMGRKTFESIGKALPNRLNIVITSKPERLSAYNICAVSNLEQAIKTAQLTAKDIFIIGGASVYRQSLDMADKLIITKVDYEGEADTFFPEIDCRQWQAIDKKVYKKNENNNFDFEIVTYVRKK